MGLQVGTPSITRRLVSLAVAGSIAVVGANADASAGEAVFAKCQACHTIGGGRLVGPDLKDVSKRRDAAWIKRFIMDPAAMLASDAEAKKLLAEFNGVPMPNLAINAADADAVVAYIDEKSAALAPPAAAPAGDKAAAEPVKADAPADSAGAAPPIAAPKKAVEQHAAMKHDKANPANIEKGKLLFTGEQRLANGGPSCISCHDVSDDAVISGGILARELTTVFKRLGGAAGVRAIIGAPPFPVMQKAYVEHPLEDAEVGALVSFLKATTKDEHMPRDTGMKLGLTGLIGSFCLLGLYTLVWRRRKTKCVNQAIYDRQVKSI